jgi:hypothetical protein
LWLSKIRKCTALSGYRCVTETTDHIDTETKRVRKGTKNEGQGLWYHGALSLMTCKKSVQYMKQKGIFDNWLLPWGQLQEGTRYHESIPGGIPELMPLDETLNMDIHASARYHVAITSHLPSDDPRIFSFATPNEISRAYLRLVDLVTGGAPSSTRIIQDCEKWVSSLEIIRQAGGKMVQGFGRNGHRERSHGNKRGGYQPKKPQGPAKWVHSDAAGMTEQQWRGSVELVNSSQHSLATQTTIETGEVSTTRTNDANATSTIDTNSMLNEEPKSRTAHSPLTVITSVTLRFESTTKNIKGPSWLRVTTMKFGGKKKMIMRDLTKKL